MRFALLVRMMKADARSTVVSGVSAVGLVVALFLLGPTVTTGQVDRVQRIEPVRPTAAHSAGLLTFEDLVYQGAFRVPEESNGESFSYGGETLAYNPLSNTLFVGSLHGMVAEISIPPPANTTRVDQLPVASFVQPFRDPADGHLRDIAESGVVLDGLLVHDGRLYGTGLIYYDATNAQRLSHFGRSLDLTRAEVTRIHQVGDTGKAGFVAGYMATVPPERS